MNFIERAVRSIEQADKARREGRSGSSTRVVLDDAEGRRDFQQANTEPQADGASPVARQPVAELPAGSGDGIPVLGDDAVTDDHGQPVGLSAGERQRRAEMRALRDRIDQVEASDEQADVSMPAAPVRATRVIEAASAALLAGAGAGSAAPGVSMLRQEPTLGGGHQDIPTLHAERLGEPRVGSRARAIGENAVPGAGVQSDASARLEADLRARFAPRTQVGGRDAQAVDLLPDSEPIDPSGDPASLPSPLAAYDPSVPTLDLAPIRAEAYLSATAASDPMRRAFESVSEELLDRILAAQPATGAARRVMVTSTRAGEGRSLCSMHLALSLAVDQEAPTIWIDADFHGKPLLETLGVREGPGLADWLDGRVRTLGALLVPSGLPTLRVMGQGSAAALLARGSRLDHSAIHDFLLALSAACPHDVIVLNAPALSLDGEAAQLATLTGQVVVVVAANETRRGALKSALASLERHTHVSLLLNKVR